MKFSIVLLASAATVLADSIHHHAKRADHAAINQRNRRNEAEAESLEKRDSFTGTATWYDVTTGPGACGDYMSPGDFVVALNSPQLQAYGGYQNGKPASCYQSITITYNGITQVATIKDECPTCGWGSLDLSQGLFSSFTSLDAGVFPLTWWFNDGSNSGGNNNNNNGNNNGWQQTTTQWVDPAPWTTSQPAWTPPTTTSSVYVPPTTTTTPPPPSTTDGGNTSQDDPSSSTQTTTDNVPMMKAAVVQMAQLINAANPH